ncbi:putative AC transposase [Fusarium oxysporum f. sp. rapae]|uniref:Putative AC transposase n=1 Tax=Fusarium oxysporum f. sp. rapae TaxID=485398 RepID=A0A8J5NQ05_FUSOX|nr:putative AC transposase [Fusarium oxysporum f. sp. rapae]
MSSDTSSIIGATENPPDVNGLPSNFLSIMDITKDHSSTRGRKTGGKTIYTCTACGDKRYDHKANAANHVRNNHPVASRSTRSVSGTQRSISAHFRPVASEDALRNAFNPQAYQEALISILTRRRVPFSAIEWDEFKQLALACNPYIKDSLITSRRTMVRYIAANYDFYSSEIKDSLTTASSPIHISTDLWTSPHRHSLLAVCAQWVDKDYKLRKAPLSLPECAESHSGEAQAQAVIDTLEKYGIQSKLGWHTGDNATSNDTCLESIQRKLMSSHKIKFNAKGRRIRCIAHIINLSLQAFLLASSKEALVAALESASGVTREELLSQFSEVLASHRKKAAAERNTAKRKNGEPARKHKRKDSTASNTSVISADDFSGVENVPALRKLHGLAVWLSSSSLHQNAWDKAVRLRLGMDNRTRWSSWYQVIDRAIRKKDKIQSFMSDHEEAIGDNRLLVGDWELLGKKIYQSDEHSDEQMVRAIDMGWFILSKYYRLTDEVPVYAAALLLDPRKRIVYIKQNWPKEWHEDTIASATAFWQKEFNYEQPSDHPSTPTSMPPPLAKKPNQLAILSKKLEVRTINASVRDDFTSFINVNATDIPPDYTPLE